MTSGNLGIFILQKDSPCSNVKGRTLTFAVIAFDNFGQFVDRKLIER